MNLGNEEDIVDNTKGDDDQDIMSNENGIGNRNSKPSFSSAWNYAIQRISNMGFQLSVTQPLTPADGSCFFHAVCDQLNGIDHKQLRRMVVGSVFDMCADKRIFWPYINGEDQQEWMGKMKKNGVFADEIACQIVR
jgi:hypothetical protein